MNDLLNDMMHERADVLGPPSLDVAGIVAAGDRQVRRRRAAMFGGGLAAVVALGAVTPSLLRLAEGPVDTVETNSFAAAFAASSPTYAVGRTVHIAGQEFTVSKPIRAFVQTDLGIVYADADGVVRSHDGISESDPLGTAVIPFEDTGLVSDGTTALWIEQHDGALRAAVFDQIGGAATYVPLERPARNQPGEVQVLAVDGDVGYVRDGRGILRIADGVATVIAAAPDGRAWLDLEDAQAGLLAHAYKDVEGDSPLVVGTTMTDDRFTITGYPNLAIFSPEGTWLSIELDDGVPAIFDAESGRELPMPVREHAWQVNFAWVDDDTYAAIAIKELGENDTEPEGDWSFDMLTCSVAETTCTVTETGLDLDDGFTLPVGADLFAE